MIKFFSDKKFYLFILLGGFNTIVGIVSLVAIDALFGRALTFLNLLSSYIVVFVVGHWISRRMIWKSNSKYFPELTKYILSYLPSLIPSVLGYVFLVSIFHLDYVLIQISISIFFSFVVFLIQKTKVFVK